LTFDITLFDEQDMVLAEIEGFMLRHMNDPARSAEKSLWARDVSHSGEEQPVEHYDQLGIEPRDGARALTLLLRTQIPPLVVVVVRPLDGLDARELAPVTRTVESSAPNQTVECALTDWWQEMLGVESVGLDDDFFGLGGHSLVGVRLFAKIKKTYGVDLQLPMLFEARTVRQLAEMIRKAKQPTTVENRTWSLLVPIQPNGSRTPLFFVHAVGGDVLFYEPLSKALGPEQPFYAFRSPLLSQAEVRETSIEELASIYIKELRAIFPRGPYMLGGASLGGIIAFEMSQQLSEQGLQPSLLLLVDPFVPGSAKRLDVKDQISGIRKKLRDEGATYLMRKAEIKIEYSLEQLVEHAKRTACFGYRVAGKSLPVTLSLFEAEEAHKRALTRYTFRTYPGKITLMRAAHRGYSISERDDPTLGWRQFAGGELEIHDVSSGHVSMLFEPYVHTFAKLLKTILPS
jgi:thioesterase domain-containing protein/acyl carrier protein